MQNKRKVNKSQTSQILTAGLFCDKGGFLCGEVWQHNGLSCFPASSRRRPSTGALFALRCVFALASSLLNAARQDKHWAELEQGQHTQAARPLFNICYGPVLTHTHSRSGCLGLCLQSDVVHQSVFELIHTDDRALFRRQLHFALKPDTTLADGSVQSPSKSTPSIGTCSVLPALVSAQVLIPLFDGHR